MSREAVRKRQSEKNMTGLFGAGFLYRRRATFALYEIWENGRIYITLFCANEDAKGAFFMWDKEKK